ncbi:MAG: glutathione S-transferase, partial [Pseudomonadota bacterium]
IRQKSPEFLKKNPLGQVPVLEDGDTVIADSNAILVYLATKYDPARRWLPSDSALNAQVQRYLSIAAGPVANGPAAARLITLFGADLSEEKTSQIAHSFFAVLDDALSRKDWLVAGHPTIADVANYAYIAHAPEGNVSLENYPNIRNWLARVEALDGFVAMQKSAVGLAA